MIGTSLGPYEIVAPLGSGGMGEVYRARDRRLDRDVAIKILPGHLSNNPELRERFEREARTISQLNHPNICTLHDVGSENGTSYLVMELIEGESLADRLAKGPLPLTQVLQFGSQIASALDRAHRNGIVHRDLKPGNIMITRSGAKLFDFGLAKPSATQPIADSSATHAGATQQKPLTQEGTIVGTYQYMAPEQLEGLNADARTDIFALGSVLYEMATGRRAFEGKTRTSLIAAIVQSEPAPISQIQPMTPPALEHVVCKCLAKDPDDRWQSAHDVADELHWISEAGSQAGVAVPIVARRRHREQLLWTAALLLIPMAFLAGRMIRPKAPSVGYRFTIPGIGPGYHGISSFRFSPDGNSIGFVASNDRNVLQLFIRPLDSLQATPVAGTEGISNWTWSPDGRSVGFLADGKLRRISIQGGGAQAIAAVHWANRGVAYGDGVILLGDLSGGLKKITLATGAVEQITKPDASKKELGHVYPNFLPDMDHFTFTTFGGMPTHTAYVGSVKSGKIKLIGVFPSTLDNGGGFVFFVSDGVAQARKFDQEKLQVTGEPMTVAENVWSHTIIGSTSFHAAPDGSVAWSEPTAESRIAIVAEDGKRIGFIGAEASMRDVRSAAGGKSLLVATVNPRLGTADIELFGVDRPTETRLTFEPTLEYYPVLSGDGSRLFFASDKAGVPDIYVKAVDGTEPERPVIQAPGDQLPMDISPDSKLLLYRTTEAGNSDLWVAPLDGGRPYPVVRTPRNDNSGRFSRDGASVAYASNVTGKAEIYVKALSGRGTALQVSTGGGHLPRWSIDGTALLFIGPDFHSLMISERRGDAFDEPRLLFRHDKRVDSFDVLPGKRLALLERDEAAASAPIQVALHWTEHAK
jgi:Tol biopolymer transport system component